MKGRTQRKTKYRQRKKFRKEGGELRTITIVESKIKKNRQTSIQCDVVI